MTKPELLPCPECNGTGVAERIGGYDRPCDACSGSGELTLFRPTPAPDVGELVEKLRGYDENFDSWNTDRLIPQDLFNLTLTALSASGTGWPIGMRVTKTKGSKWTGKIVGYYSTELTPEGYAVESETEIGSVQIYPRAALAPTPPQEAGK
jgi:dihydrofolate reductase (trimethoprim resistance protein)